MRAIILEGVLSRHGSRLWLDSWPLEDEVADLVPLADLTDDLRAARAVRITVEPIPAPADSPLSRSLRVEL